MSGAFLLKAEDVAKAAADPALRKRVLDELDCRVQRVAAGEAGELSQVFVNGQQLRLIDQTEAQGRDRAAEPAASRA
jgi:hypothetical protein